MRKNMALIEYKDLCFRYALSNHQALKNINLTIAQGEIVLVTGASGCGKTTLLSMINKTIMPYGETQGSVTYQGQDIKNVSAKALASQIGYVGQSPQDQIVTDKVWHEIAFGLENLGYNNVEIRKKTAEAAAYFGMADWYRMDTSKLSGGQKQLLNLASVMAMNPSVIVLDEPTSQLDPIAAQKFIDMINRLNKELGITIIISEHRTEQLFSMSDKIVTLKNGSITYQGEPEKVALSIIQASEDIRTLPTAAKIYHYVMTSFKELKSENFESTYIDSKTICPLTVRDARKWLQKIMQKDTLQKNTEKQENKKVSQVTLYPTRGFSQNFLFDKNDFIIRVKNVCFCYGKHEAPVLHDVSLDVKKGEFLAVTGGNGAGKTTLLKLIAGVRKPASGKINIHGRCILVSQNPKAMFTEISVEEELAEVLCDTGNQWAKQMNREEKLKVLEQLLNKTDLCAVRKQHPYDISGGQQQKLAIAKGLLWKPDILLLDEPTKGLDPAFKEELGNYIQHLIQTDKLTVIMVSHDLDFCAEYADECAFMFDHSIISKTDVVTFFEQNNYYTTSAAKIASGYIKRAVTYKQVGEKLCKNMI